MFIAKKLKSTVSRTWKLTTGLFASTLLAMAFFTSTASAAASCNTGYICFYVDAYYTGLSTQWYQPSIGCHNFSSTFNDNISSFINKSSRSITLFVNGNCSNGLLSWDVGNDSYINLSGSGFNDVVSSFYVYQ